MKCYICITDSVIHRKDYMDLLEVTLLSARKNTSLQMICLYDGAENDAVHLLLLKYNIEVIFHEFPYKQELREIYSHKWMMNTLGKEIEYSRIYGAFMRWEIPVVEKEDLFVLYCDIDVIFNKDITLDDIPHPCYLAASSEFEKDVHTMTYFNSGVLVLNIEGMKLKYNMFADMMRRKERNSVDMFDQGYLNQLCYNDMEILPVEFNWKPYWGINHNASIIHLHGMKPGSEIFEAGFNTTDVFFLRIFRENKEGYAGYVYYFSQFFSYLNRVGDTWLSKHLQYVFDLFRQPIDDEQGKKVLQQKVKKYKSLFNASLVLVLLIFLLFLVFCVFFIR